MRRLVLDDHKTEVSMADHSTATDSATSPADALPPDHLPEQSSLLGDTLAPLLVETCEQRLGSITWFRTDWQRGGALTGYADWHESGDGDDGDRRAVVKLPVPPVELQWLRRLQPTDANTTPAVPRLLASGEEIGRYDFAWVVLERMDRGPLDGSWGGAEVELLLDAAVRFHAAADRHPCDKPPRAEDWPDTLRRSRAIIRDQALPEGQRWNAAVKTLGKKIKKLVKIWNARDTAHWCHGDLHFGNAMTAAAPDSPAVLFDLAKVHAGHWIEDAVNFEHLYWAVPGRLGDDDVVKRMNRLRKQHGLRIDEQWPQLAIIRRAMVAAAAPLEAGGQANPAYLQAALGVLERSLPLL